MTRVIETALIVVFFGMALTFGGVVPLAYSLATVVLFLVILALVVTQCRAGKITLSLPVWPVLFALWVVLQIFPLPARLIASLAPSRASDFGLGSLSLGGVGSSTLSIDGHETLVSIFKFLSYLSAFLLAAYVFDSRKKKSHLVRSLIVLGCFEAGYGIVQYLTGWHKIFTYTKVFDLEDATGTYINRNHFAGLLELVLPFVLAAAYYSFQKRTEPSQNGDRHPPTNVANSRVVFYLLILVIMGVALVFSRSRGGILAAALSLVFIGLLGQVKGERKTWMLLVVLFLTVVVAYGLWIGLDPVLTRFEQVGQKNFLQLEGRKAMWQGAVHLVRDYPLTGSGLGTFGLAFRHYQTDLVDMYVDHAHNDYLEFASETGLPGLALLFLPILYLFGRMIIVFLNAPHRYQRSVLLGCIGSTLAVLIHSVIDFNLQIPANALTFAIILGIAYKTAIVERREQ